MRRLNSLFGKKQPLLTIRKTDQLLNEDLYWSIIGESLQNSNDQNEQEAYLIERIGQLTLTEMVEFKLRTTQLLDDSYTSEMWCAAYIINNDFSDDCFDYFRFWLISRGKSMYYAVRENPDSLANEVSTGETCQFEAFDYVADEAFINKTKSAAFGIHDYYDYFQLSGMEFNWNKENSDSMRKICPQLFEKFWQTRF